MSSKSYCHLAASGAVTVATRLSFTPDQNGARFYLLELMCRSRAGQSAEAGRLRCLPWRLDAAKPAQAIPASPKAAQRPWLAKVAGGRTLPKWLSDEST